MPGMKQERKLVRYMVQATKTKHIWEKIGLLVSSFHFECDELD